MISLDDIVGKSAKYVVIALVVIFVLYFLIFMFIRPFNYMIVEDKPIYQRLCDMQVECHVGVGTFQCGYSEYTPKHYWVNVSHSLDSHPWYKGCNESTQGFFVTEFGLKYVSGIKICSCGGLQ